MRALLTADIQLHAYTHYSGVNSSGYNSRAFDLIEKLKLITVQEHAKAPLDAVFVVGDIFENKALLEVDILDLIHGWFIQCKEMGIRVILIPGNHDHFLKNEQITSLKQFEGYCEVYSEPKVLSVGKQLVALSPFRHELSQINQDLTLLRDQTVNSPNPILLGHWSVVGATNGIAQFTEGVDPANPDLSHYSYVLLGDIHNHQVIPPNITYLGSPAQHTFGERGDEKFVWVFEDSRLRGVPTNLPQFVYADTVEEACKLRKEGHFVKLKASSKGEFLKASDLDIPVENTWVESVSTDNRPAVSSYADAVKAWGNMQGLSSEVIELGEGYINAQVVGRITPLKPVVIESVNGVDFMSYEKLEFDLHPSRGLVVLHGEVVGQTTFDSNGAGKTTLYELIYYALYGRTLRFGVSKDDTVREGQKTNEVQLIFRTDEECPSRYKITRSRTSGLKFEHLIPGGDSFNITNTDSRLTQASIETLVGDKDLFSRLTLMALAYRPSFMNMGDADKKNFIDKYGGFDVFSSARGSVQDFLNSLDGEINVLKNLQRVLADRTSQCESSIQRLTDSIGVFEAEEDRKQVIKEENVQRLLSELEGLSETPVPEEPNTFEVTRIESTMDVIRDLITTAKTELATNIAPLQSDIRSLKALLNKGGYKAGDVCPSCKRGFDHDENPTDTVHIQSEIDCKEQEVKSFQDALAPALKQAEDQLKALMEEKREAEGVVRSLSSKRQEVLNQNVRVVKDRERKLAEVKSLQEVGRASPASLQKELDVQQDLLDKTRQEFVSTQDALNVKTETKGNHSYWLNGFGSRGCKSLMYTSFIDALNKHLQKACNLASGGVMSLRMLPYASKEDSAQEKISMEIINQGGSSTLTGDSLGERARIDICVDYALKRTLEEFTQFWFNLYFCDEPWMGLDVSGKRAVYDLLHQEADRNGTVIVTDQDNSVKACVTNPGNVWIARKQRQEGSKGVSSLIIPSLVHKEVD